MKFSKVVDGRVLVACAEGEMNDLIQLASASYGFLIQRHETLTGDQFADRIARVYARIPRNREVMAALRCYQWVDNAPYKCDLCQWHIDIQPALKMGEYILCAKCAEENLVAADICPVGGLFALAARDGIKIQYKEETWEQK